MKSRQNGVYSQKSGGGGTPVKKVSVQDMIAQLKEKFDISDEEALHIREVSVSEEKIADESIHQTVTLHQHDHQFLFSAYKNQVCNNDPGWQWNGGCKPYA